MRSPSPAPRQVPLPLHELQRSRAPRAAGSHQMLLLLGRLLIAGLSAAVCGTELWRLLGTPLTSFDNGDGHDDLRLRVPQLLLSLPLALGLGTSRVAGALAVLVLAEALRTDQDLLVVPGAHFGMERYLRIGFGPPESELTEALERLEASLDGFAARVGS